MSWRSARWFGRSWQDVIFAAGEVVFLVALLPLLWDRHAHVPPFTGLTTAGMLYCFTVAQVSYRNWITVGLGTVTATVWLLLGIGI